MRLTTLFKVTTYFGMSGHLIAAEMDKVQSISESMMDFIWAGEMILFSLKCTSHHVFFRVVISIERARFRKIPSRRVRHPVLQL